MTAQPRIPAAEQSAARAGGHWILARLGKKVLRPGGRETTEFLLDNVPLQGSTVIEFAPGLGVTAKEILSRRPSRYIGVDEDADACANVRANIAAVAAGPSGSHEVINAAATASGLPDATADVIVGEAMLTMTTDKHKKEIMAEAARLLRPGGLYAIHELCLNPDTISAEHATAIQRELATSIKVNARPLTVPEWADIARSCGFEIIDCYRADMALLSPGRNIRDEGIKGTARIFFNVLRQPDLRARVLTMRATFNRHKDNLGAVGLILRKQS
nr:class I SAM-dependent methyltransferase [Corynebacterium sp. UBA5992]